MISRVVPLFMIVLTFCTFHSFHILKLNWTKNVVPKGLCASCNWNATKHSNLDTLTDRTPSTEHMCFSQKLPILCDYSISSDECEAFFEGNKPPPSVHSIRIPENASVDDEISAECDRIRERGYYANEAFSSEEREFPLAFVRVVYKEYHLQELLLNLMWSPQNFYCYALDKQSSPLFHEQMKNLSHCFDNVVLTSVEYPVKSSGWNMYSSILECLKVIIEKSGWKYAIILQNHDIPIKTNREIVDILKLFNGSNDIAVYAQSKRRTPRFDNWTYAALHLFKDESLNDNRTIKIAKGNIGCSLSRPFVEFIVRELNLIELIRRFESIGYGSDEMLFPTLHSNDELTTSHACTHASTMRSGSAHSCSPCFCTWAKRSCVVRLQLWFFRHSPMNASINEHVKDCVYDVITCCVYYSCFTIDD
ncbi:hypothetical protein AB6A40_001372 [Gnathostoma spinigerum]|uniref:Core-2/I-Branching enzyme n=1 Tax=Gnathostoma spinigerum TaxID=75299 RepID=A0ABD6E406_9BILA